MQIDREMLARMAGLDDKELWGQICRVAEQHGYALRTNQPSHTELEKIRSLMRGDVQINPRDAMKLINEYKKRG